jgi:hypothetical protein
MAADDKRKNKPGSKKVAKKTKKKAVKASEEEGEAVVANIDDWDWENTEMLGAYIPVDLKNKLKILAKRHYRSLSQEVVRGLVYYLEELEAGNVKEK